MGSYLSNTVLWAQRRAGFSQKVSWVLLKKALEGWIGVCQVSRAGEKWGLLQGQHDGDTVWITGHGEEGAGKSDNPSYENLTDHAKERLFYSIGRERYCVLWDLMNLSVSLVMSFLMSGSSWLHAMYKAEVLGDITILYSSEGSGKGLDLGKEGLFWILGISLTEIWGQRT